MEMPQRQWFGSHVGCLVVFGCFIGVIVAARDEEMGVNLLLMEKEGGKASGNI
jgi:hypothetical protein